MKNILKTKEKHWKRWLLMHFVRAFCVTDNVYNWLCTSVLFLGTDKLYLLFNIYITDIFWSYTLYMVWTSVIDLWKVGTDIISWTLPLHLEWP